MLIRVYNIVTSKSQKYASQLIEDMAMLSEAKEHRFILFANIFPLIFRRKNSIAVIYDIAHDFFPEAYSRFRRNYLRFAVKCALRLAPKIIVPSESAKKDILKFYPPKGRINPEKIFVAYCVAGYGLSHEKTLGFPQREKPRSVSALARPDLSRDTVPARAPNVFLRDNPYPACSSDSPYFLYVGRIELKKNILGILRAFDLFKAEYKSPYKLILAGDFGFGGDRIKEIMVRHRFKNDIIFISKFSEEKINQLFSEADVFLQPSFYESDGGEILRSQSYGLPVITSCISSMPEITGEGAVLVNPHDIEEMKEAMIRVAADKDFRDHLSQRGRENIKRFSWQSCAKQTLDIIVK